MLLKDIQPFVRQALVTKLDRSSSRSDISTWFQAPDCRLFYIINGHGKMEMENATYDLAPGCAIIFQAGTRYMWNVEKINYIAINFDYTSEHSHITSPFHPIQADMFTPSNIIETVGFEDTDLLNEPLFIKDALSTEYFFRILTTELYIGQEYDNELLSSCLKTLIISFVRMANAQKQEKHSIVQKIIQYIQNNYNKDLDNEKISELVHLNSSYTNRVFKQYTGTTMHKFLVDYRINLALELLRTSTDSINEIAAAVGFADVPHFVKSFKSYTGKTPTQYRSSGD